MKFTHSTLLAALSLFSIPALASGPANPEMTIYCTPARKMSSPLAVKWDRLLEVVSIEGSRAGMTMRSKVYYEFDKATQTVTDTFTASAMVSGAMTQLIQTEADQGLRYNAAFFHISEMKLPDSAGPVPPGTYNGTAALILISESRGKPGEGLLEPTVAKVHLNCKFDIRY